MNIAIGSAQGLFLIVCPKCLSQAFLLTELTIGGTPAMPIINDSMTVQTKSASEVTANDILDMHNFLKSFKGDVSHLFNEL